MDLEETNGKSMWKPSAHQQRRRAWPLTSPTAPATKAPFPPRSACRQNGLKAGLQPGNREPESSVLSVLVVKDWGGAWRFLIHSARSEVRLADQKVCLKGATRGQEQMRRTRTEQERALDLLSASLPKRMCPQWPAQPRCCPEAHRLHSGRRCSSLLCDTHWEWGGH